MQQIEDDALDSTKSVADALRKCIALGGHSGSDELRTWAARELKGYERPEDVPDYRIIAAPIVIDGVAGFNYISRQQISPHDLPDVAQEAGISETLPLTSGIGELEEMALRARERNEAIGLGLPGGASLAKLMTHEWGSQHQSVQRVYWSVSPTAVFGVVDLVRTKLVELVAQMRSDTGSSQDPPADIIQNAVNVVIHGKRSRVSINTAQSSGSGDATVKEGSDPDPSSPWWRTTRAVWSFVVGAATIAAAVLAYLALN